MPIVLGKRRINDIAGVANQLLSNSTYGRVIVDAASSKVLSESGRFTAVGHVSSLVNS